MKWKIAVIISVLFCFSAVAQDEIPEVLFEFTAIPDSMFYLNGQLYLCANPNSEERHSTGLVLALSDDDQKVVVTHGGGWYNRSPSNFVTFNNRLYFQYGEPGRNVMWINYLYTADKNTGALTRLTEYTVGDITPMGDHLFYSRYTLTKGYELMTYNDVEGERVFKDLAPGKPSSWPHNFYAVNNKLFFYAFSADIGYELYVSDGTPDGTRLVKDINVGAGSSNRYTDQKIHVEWEEVDAKDFVYIYPFFSCNNICYFHADDGVHGYELWRTDGTSSGTYLVKDINPGSENAFPYERTTQFRFQEPKVPLRCVYNNEFYFLAKTPANGYEL